MARASWYATSSCGSQGLPNSGPQTDRCRDQTRKLGYLINPRRTTLRSYKLLLSHTARGGCVRVKPDKYGGKRHRSSTT
ncbi:hypothetical protein CCHR01_13749 [Colletotrichum chrysophilum]|uniref:Uncharacterized protein n=1 Tax=Colletotrichum chrysophilum TaxID=1836956 RepID=A0AAD9EDE8_9PEZI|nr:hypothetical protein CCHR01_13749 [Colletotrichum chrysophilum]